MKKLISVLVVASVLMGAGGIAEGFDPKNYTTEELQIMYALIEQELEARGKGLGSYIPWYNTGLGIMLPVFELASGEELQLGGIMHNTDKDFYASVDNATEEDYNNYILKVQLAGYTEKARMTSFSYEAFNEDGFQLEVICWGSSGTTVKLTPPRK